jgi:hypothetical protein
MNQRLFAHGRRAFVSHFRNYRLIPDAWVFVPSNRDFGRILSPAGARIPAAAPIGRPVQAAAKA